MALIKEIVLDNGITVNYHRVVSVNNITNISSIIEVGSYISKEKRLEEKAKIEAKEPMNIFIHTEYHNINYDPMLNVDSAYAYLKTTDQFKHATNDLD